MALQMEYKAGFDNLLETKGCGKYSRVIGLDDLDSLKPYYSSSDIKYVKEQIKAGFEVIEFVNGGVVKYDNDNNPIEMIEVTLTYIDEDGDLSTFAHTYIPNGDYFNTFCN